MASGPAEFRFRKGRGSALGRGATERAKLANFAAVGGAPAVQRAVRQRINEDRPGHRSGRHRRTLTVFGDYGSRRRSARGLPGVSAGAVPGRWPRSEGVAAHPTMPPGPPMTATPAGRVGVLWFDQAQADPSSVLIHSLDRLAVQLRLADHGRCGVKPSLERRRWSRELVRPKARSARGTSTRRPHDSSVGERLGGRPAFSIY